ncbi:MBL fold metallo-hydrolase [Litorihabitans aurantiacus]|uniref:Metal-dependent hydrolase n=1 Tax=Litorihabitans aurantiacus TaxID=1930061 RepID=A0AA38CTL6_9MICO|nr:MBL fold metallo-hydrolase [Litorihabitans aurantiacus]GMA31962.1 metal-dependent hydrolase [Litorihabitans aurantiacus]
MRLTVVGCSGSMPGPGSAASSYLVQSDGTAPSPGDAAANRTWNVLLDLGSGAFGPLQTLLQPHDVDAVLLSHLHPDHCADLTALAVWLRYGPGSVLGTGGAVPPERRVRVIGPAGTAERLAELSMEMPGDVAATFDVETVADGDELAVGPLRVAAHEVRHPVTAFAYRLTGPDGEVLTYTGDTDSCDGVERAAAGADLLLSEAAFTDGVDEVRGIHLTGSRAGALARDAGVRRLLLTHLQPWADPERIRDDAAAVYDGPVALARAGQVDQVLAHS